MTLATRQKQRQDLDRKRLDPVARGHTLATHVVDTLEHELVGVRDRRFAYDAAIVVLEKAYRETKR